MVATLAAVVRAQRGSLEAAQRRRSFVHANFIPALIAGVIEGIVERLPVSSKTMLTLYFAAIGLKVQYAYALGLIANFGSFFAAVVYFRQEVWGALKSLRRPFSDEPYAQLLRFVVIGTLATGIVGIPIYLVVQKAFSAIGGSIAMLVIGALLVVTAIISRGKERLMAKQNDPPENAKPVGMSATLITGGMQGLAALPGISRSAITTTPLLLMGFSAAEALRLSFLLDVVALVGAGVVPVVVGRGGRGAIGQFGVMPTVIMLVVAAIVSFLAIRFVLGLARKRRTSTITFLIGIVTIIVPLAALITSH